ncbi:MAG: hypothetical protein U0326_07290 [Polyangiales bacterium]
MTDRFFLLPGSDGKHNDVIAPVDPAALLRFKPDLGALLPSCVPSPYAEAEVMATILRDLPAGGTTHTDVKTTEKQRQSFQRWQVLLKAVLLGRLSIENVPLRSDAADNFGRALAQSRDDKEFQGILWCQDIAALNLSGRKRRVVGGLDEDTLVWCGPRLLDADWSTLEGIVQGTDGLRALTLLHLWRMMLVERGLWGTEGTMRPWMRGVDRMLDGFKVEVTWAALQDNVRMAGPVRLTFPHPNAPPESKGFTLDVFMPVHHMGWAASFASTFHLQPKPAETGGVNLVGDSSGPYENKVGQFIQLGSGQRPSAPTTATISHVGMARNEDALLAGLGSRHVFDPLIQGDRWWLQDRDNLKGYRSEVYEPLMKDVKAVHARSIQVRDDDIQKCPILFPDTLRLAHDLLDPPAGMSGVEFVTLKEKHGNAVRGWPFPMHGTLLGKDLPLSPPDATWVIALENSPSAPCLLERLNLGNGTVVEVGELRALGALLWEIFTGEAEFKSATSLAITRTSLSTASSNDNELASAARDSQPRIILKETLLKTVESALYSQQDSTSRNYRKALQQRRATAQRFLALWTLSDPSIEVSAGWWLGNLAARVFINWAYQGVEKPDTWGKVPDLSRSTEKKLMVTRTLSVPLHTDPYPRRR